MKKEKMVTLIFFKKKLVGLNWHFFLYDQHETKPKTSLSYAYKLRAL